MRILVAVAISVAACDAVTEPTCEETYADDQYSMTCKGENYDVDNDPANCCEVADYPTDNHLWTAENATYVGSFPCDDGASNPDITGRIPSDLRVHTDPTMSGFDDATGSAPDYYRLWASGGLCVNDLNLTLLVSDSTMPSCYQLSVLIGDGSYDCQTGSGGACSIAQGIGSYADGSEIYLRVSKTCTPASPDNPSYTVTGHL